MIPQKKRLFQCWINDTEQSKRRGAGERELDQVAPRAAGCEDFWGEDLVALKVTHGEKMGQNWTMKN